VAARPHEVRIIGGQWKRSKLPVADKPGLRPTPDRVRETLFNWLGQDLTGWRCLDAFAGSGALGFEAASRGAAEVLLLERMPELVAQPQRLQRAAQGQCPSCVSTDAMSLDGALPRRPASIWCCSTRPSTPAGHQALTRSRAAAGTGGGLCLPGVGRACAEPPPGAWCLHRAGRAGAVHHLSPGADTLHSRPPSPTRAAP
jgi:16S rRNA (guanine966-N2)-methyltransferase